MADGLAASTGVLEVAGGGGGLVAGGGLVGGGGPAEPDDWAVVTVNVTGIVAMPALSDWIVTVPA
jgi:hypothetical protein